MKKLLTSTAIALALGGTAVADDHSNLAIITYDQATEMNLTASELTGMRVYASENDVTPGMTIADGGETEWNDIGDINELYITPDGEVAAVIVGVGGFLGMGERDVAVDMSEIRMVREEGESDEFFLVIEASRADLENAPVFEEPEEMDMASNDTTMDNDAMETNTLMDRELFAMPAIERDGYMDADHAQLSSDTLLGANVFGINDEDIGEVSNLILNDGGQVEHVIMDIGGFLGLGEKQVEMSMDELQILRTEDGDEFRVYVDASQEQLEQLPEYQVGG